MKGQFHKFGPVSQARCVQVEAAAVKAAFNTHPHSRAACQAALRPLGLVAATSPLDELVPLGLDRFTGITFSPRHMIYEGMWKVLVEATLAKLQTSLGNAAAFNSCGKSIDVWIESYVSCCPFIKGHFSRGMSHFFYSAMATPHTPWISKTIKFGKITSFDVHRDIMRFWRLLLIDLLPDDVALMELFTDYLEWVRLALRLVHTDTSLLHMDTYCEAWLNDAVDIFGADLMDKRLKAHAPTHLAAMIRHHFTVLFGDDKAAESAHVRGAQEPWEHTNRGKTNVNKQMTAFICRNDVLSLLTILDDRRR